MVRWLMLFALVAQVLLLPAPTQAAGGSLADADAALQQGDYVTAQVLYEDLIAADPGSQVAWLGLARAYAGRENWPLAVQAYEQAATLGDLPVDAQAALAAARAVVSVLVKEDPATSKEPATVPAPQPTEDWSEPAPSAPAPAIPDPAPVQAAPRAEPQPADKPDAPQAGSDAVEVTAGTLDRFTTWPESSTGPVSKATEITPAPPAALVDAVQPPEAPSESAPMEPLPAVNAFRRSSGGTPLNFVIQAQPAPDAGSEPAPPTTAEGWLAQARDHVAHNEWPEAVAAYEQYIQKVQPDLTVRLEYANALREAGQMETAEHEYNRILHDDAENVEAKLGLAKVLGMTERVEEAMELLDTMYLDPEAYIQALLVKAWVYNYIDDPATALNMIGEVLARDPQNPDALEARKVYGRVLDEQRGLTGPAPLPGDPAGRADALFNRGEYDEALQNYEEAVAANPELAGAWKQLAKLYSWASRWEDAADAYEHYLGLVPDDFEARLGYAQALLWSGKKSEARAELDALVVDPDIPIELYGSALLSYATALSATGDKEKALRYYQEALVYDPESSEARAAYAGALSGQGQYAEAQQAYRSLIRDDPSYEAAKIGLAQSYAWQGQGAAARKYYDTVAMDSSYYGASLIGKAYTYLWEGDFVQARKYAEMAAQQDPGNPDLAALYKALGVVPDPQMVSTWRQTHDSEDNDYRGVLTELTVPLAPNGAALHVTYEDFKLDNSTSHQVSDGTSTGVALTVPLSPDVRVRAGAENVDIRNGADPNASHWDVNSALEVDLTDDWTAGFGYSTQALRDTPRLARSRINLDEYALTSTWRVFDDNTHLIGYYARGDLNDGNSRHSWSMNLKRSAEVPKVALVNYGVLYRELCYALNLNNGYWDPDHYRYGELYLDWIDQTDNDLRFDGSVGLGMDKDTARASNNVFRYAVGLRSYLFNNRFLLRGGYASSDAATTATTGPGYKSKSWYLTGEFKF